MADSRHAHCAGQQLLAHDGKPEYAFLLDFQKEIRCIDEALKLADIGLVTDVGASISYVGTEGFLPPEGPVSQQADIYSLGKVLYEMSTGQDRLEFPELPTFLGESEQKAGLLELNLVFLKACQNDPQKRYRTAQEMYADLVVLRSGKSLKRARALEKRLESITHAFVAISPATASRLIGRETSPATMADTMPPRRPSTTAAYAIIEPRRRTGNVVSSYITLATMQPPAIDEG